MSHVDSSILPSAECSHIQAPSTKEQAASTREESGCRKIEAAFRSYIVEECHDGSRAPPKSTLAMNILSVPLLPSNTSYTRTQIETRFLSSPGSTLEDWDRKQFYDPRTQLCQETEVLSMPSKIVVPSSAMRTLACSSESNRKQSSALIPTTNRQSRKRSA